MSICSCDSQCQPALRNCIGNSETVFNGNKFLTSSVLKCNEVECPKSSLPIQKPKSWLVEQIKRQKLLYVT